jgi:hypothetical protein
MRNEAEIDAYLREISVILDTYPDETTSYAKYRAIGDGFKLNVDWLEDTSPPTISFFNGVTAMLDLAVVMSVSKMIELIGTKGVDYRPGEIVAVTKPGKRKAHDEIRSLPRLAFLLRSVCVENDGSYARRYAQRQREIVAQYDLAERDVRDYAENIEKDRLFLLELCDRVDALAVSDECEKLSIVRSEGFAHSSAISRKSISLGIEPDTLDFTRTMLFGFGDQVMQLALDFEAVWYQRSRPPIRDLIKKSVQTGETFWAGARKGLASDETADPV